MRRFEGFVVNTPKQSLLRSPLVVASCILASGLVAAALILKGSPGPSLFFLWSARNQFCSQMTAQLEDKTYSVLGQNRQAQDIEIEKVLVSPKADKMEIDYRIDWSPGPMHTYTSCSLDKDDMGRFTSDWSTRIGDAPNSADQKFYVHLD